MSSTGLVIQMIISVFWVCMSTASLGVKAVLMIRTKRDVERVDATIQEFKDHYAGAQLGNKIFWVTSVFGLLVTLCAYAIGLIKVWVLIVDAAIFVVCVIMNIVFLGYLRKKASQ